MNNSKIDVTSVGPLLSDPDTQGLVILTIAMAIVGDELFGNEAEGIEPLDPAEVYAMLHEVTGSWLSEEGENKLMAMMTAVESDDFYNDPLVFVSVVMALYEGDLGDLVNQVFEMPGATEMLWAISEVELAKSDEDELPTFSISVQAIIDEVLAAEQETYEHVKEDVNEEYARMMANLLRIGISWDDLRLLAAEYVETLEGLEAASDVV